MNARVKLYQNLINDVFSEALTLKDVRNILGTEYSTWVPIYEKENRAKQAYKKYVEALDILEKAKLAYEKSVVDANTKRKLYDKYSAALRRAEERFGRMIKPIWEALEAMGAVEQDLIDDPLYKMVQIKQYMERTGNNDLNVPVPFTGEEKLRMAVFGQKLKQKVVSFNNIFQRTLVMEHNFTQHVTKPYIAAQTEMFRAKIEMEQALKNKETTQIDYESYVLFSILGIL